MLHKWASEQKCLKDLSRENLLKKSFLGPLWDAKNEKKLDPDPPEGPHR